MRECDHFVLSREDHIMVAHNGAAADSGNADLFDRSLLSSHCAVIDILILISERFVCSVRKSQRSAAGSVDLLVVVFFHDLDVKARRRELGCRLGDQSLQEIDADRHIGGLEDRCLFGSFPEGVHLLLRESCGAHHYRNLLICAVSEKPVNSGSC